VKTIPSFALYLATLRLSRFLSDLDPEDERKLHRAAPQVHGKLTAIRAEVASRNLRPLTTAAHCG
jgi:hypothetical protein